MGVYIKGMEMPFVGSIKTIVIYPDGTVRTRQQDPLPYTAVPVPPHGDLIDKDATMNAILEERGEDTACWFAGIVNDMPAVILSDKAEEGE